MIIVTPRLEVVPAGEALVRAAMAGPAALGEALRAEVAPGWPPDQLDASALQYTLDRLAAGAEHAGWWMHVVVLVRSGGASGPRTVIGSGGYCGPPSPEGTVEVGYTIVPEHQRRGYATEMARGLIGRAFADPRVQRVFGETLPDLIASRRVMQACGMQPAADVSGPGVVRFAITRADWERTRGPEPR